MQYSERQSPPATEDLTPPFEFHLPRPKPQYENDSPFAVGPGDPRYYQDSPNLAVVTEAEDPNKSKLKRKETSTISSDFEEETEGTENSEDKPSHSAIYQPPAVRIVEEDERSDLYFTGTWTCYRLQY